MKDTTIIKPGETKEVKVEFTPEAIERINNGEAVKFEVVFTLPFLKTKWATNVVMALTAYGLISIVRNIIELVIDILYKL